MRRLDGPRSRRQGRGRRTRLQTSQPTSTADRGCCCLALACRTSGRPPRHRQRNGADWQDRRHDDACRARRSHHPAPALSSGQRHGRSWRASSGSMAQCSELPSERDRNIKVQTADAGLRPEGVELSRGPGGGRRWRTRRWSTSHAAIPRCRYHASSAISRAALRRTIKRRRRPRTSGPSRHRAAGSHRRGCGGRRRRWRPRSGPMTARTS